MFLTALREDARAKLKTLGTADILVGIPCYNDQETIAHVVEVVGDGLRRYYPDARSLIMLSDGGSVDDSRELAAGVQLPLGIDRLVTIYRGVPGKGTSLRAVFEMSEALKAKAVVVVDADLRSLTPEWMKDLIQPVLDGTYTFVTPFYARHKFDGTITKFVAYPLVRTFFGRRIFQPIGGDFGMAADLVRFYARQDVWETEIAKFGIDIWLTVNAIEHGGKVCQAKLGAKVHAPKDPSSLGPMFREVIGTLFGLITAEDMRRPRVPSEAVPLLGDRTPAEPPAVEVDVAELTENFKMGFDHFAPIWREILSKEVYAGVAAAAGGVKTNSSTVSISDELWAKAVYDCVIAYSRWRSDRQKLVALMTPLYYGRVTSYVAEAAGASQEEADALVERQAQVFEDLEPYLLKRARGV